MRRRRALRQFRKWADLSIIGIQFPVAIVIGYLWGRTMDRWFGTWPWLTGIFSLFGIAAGFLNLFRMTAEATRREDEDTGDGSADGNGSG